MSQMIPGPLTYDERSSSDTREFFKLMPLDAGQVNPDLISFFDDFTGLHGKALNATDMYDVVKDAGAAVAVADVLNGVARITCTNTTDNDGGLLQMNNGCFARVTGKKLWFEASVKIHDADDCDMFVGLAEQAATDPEAVAVDAIHRLGFELNEGAATILFVSGNGTTALKTSTGVSMADTTLTKLGFFYNGSTIDVYVNRVKKLTGIAAGPASSTDLMGLAFMYRSGNATGQHVSEMDYWMVVAER